MKPRDLPDPSGEIDKLIAGIADWRGATFARLRKIVRAADPQIVEEFKWMGSPAWSCDGLIAVGNAFKGRVNLTFAHGASLEDPDELFNAGFEGNARRVINVFEHDAIDERALTALVRSAIAYNRAHLKKNAKKPIANSAKIFEKKTAATKTPTQTTPAKASLAKTMTPKITLANAALARKTAAKNASAGRTSAEKTAAKSVPARKSAKKTPRAIGVRVKKTKTDT